jgi:hypothetical protein
MGLGVLALIVLGVFGIPTLIASGGGAAFVSGGFTPAVTAGLVSMGLVLSLIGLVAIAVGVIVSILEEVSLRYAVLDDRGAVESIRSTWSDLRSKRGVGSMWLVMLLVNIAAGIAAAILFIPVVIVIGIVVAGAVAAGGTAMLWLIGPAVLVLAALGMLFKAVYATFLNTAWTSFYGRMQHPDGDVIESAPAGPIAA